LFHADRQTDMTKLIVAFRNCANAPKMEIYLTTFLVLKYYMTCANIFVVILYVLAFNFSGLGIQINPRVTELKITDSSQSARLQSKVRRT
jgi:hypothetical protein